MGLMRYVCIETVTHVNSPESELVDHVGGVA